MKQLASLYKAITQNKDKVLHKKKCNIIWATDNNYVIGNHNDFFPDWVK
jgi:hypothetical protein